MFLGWLRGRLYRKLFFSFIGLLVVLLITNIIFWKSMTRSRMGGWWSPRFHYQTAMAVERLRKRLAEAKPSRNKTARKDVSLSRFDPWVHILRDFSQEVAFFFGASVSMRTNKGLCVVQAFPLGKPKESQKHLLEILKSTSRSFQMRGAKSRRKAVSNSLLAEYLSAYEGRSLNTPFVESVLPSSGRCHIRWRPGPKLKSAHTIWLKIPGHTKPQRLDVRFRWFFPSVYGRGPWTFVLGLCLIFFTIALFTFPISRGITRPLRRLRESVESMQRGDLSQEVTSKSLDEVGDLARRIEAMRQSLWKLSEQRRVLISDLSHEIRTPLARIRTASESVADGLYRESAALTRTMEGVCEQVDEVDRLLEDLLLTAKFDLLERRLLQIGKVSPQQLLEDACRAIEVQADTHQQKIVLSVPPEGVEQNLDIEADEGRLRQVLNNLLQNAMRYTPSGSAIFLSWSVEGNGVRFEVCDQGQGIPQEERERIFERLYRLDRSRARHTGGQGLGLAIVKQLVEAHRGKVGVTNAEGGGACFWFWLPTEHPA